MVCPGDVRNIFCSGVPHVAACAVAGFPGDAMQQIAAGYGRPGTSSGKMTRAARRRREVRIMTTRAGHLIPAHTLARALCELFDFAYSTSSQVIAGVDIKGKIVGDGIAGMIVECGMSGTFHRNISFEMTTDADCESRRSGSRCAGFTIACFAAATDMALCISMASFAGDAGMQKCQSTISVDGSRIAVLYRTHMAAQTTAFHGQRRRHLRHLCQARFHIIAVRRCIPRDRRLE